MRKLLAVLIVSFGCLGAIPDARAQFCPGVSPWVFDDVLASDPFCGFITKIAQQNVTLGCIIIDANHRLYCPDDSVTRKQMAAFMARLGDALFPLTCASGQVLKWNGSAWACANDNGGGGGGTVTSVMAGTGLQGSPNPITGSGSLNLAPSYQLPQACSNGQVPKSNGSGGWACATDAGGVGTVTSVTAGTGLTGGTITGSGSIAADTAYLQRRVASNCAVGLAIRSIAADGSVTCQATGPANAFAQGGNAFGTLPANSATFGTTDANALDIRVNNSRVMRYEPNAISPNVIGGSVVNIVTQGVRGATIAGGGVPGFNIDPDFINEAPNRVTDAYGTVGGGYANRAGDDQGSTIDAAFATVGGGNGNTASGSRSTVGGGIDNIASGFAGTVGGGDNNAAANWGMVGGGTDNTASGNLSTVSGGTGNTASGLLSTIGGGKGNTASGSFSTVGGGIGNTAIGIDSFAAGNSNIASGNNSIAIGSQSEAHGNFSVALGRGAQNLNDGSFQFADSSPFLYTTSGVNNFRARATGGVRFTTGIDGNGNTTWSCVTSDGTGWSCASDRNLKQDLVELDGAAVLGKLAALPVYQWQPKGKNAHVKHYGPMAQDFHAAFGLGDDDTMIGFQDADGVALAAIKGLHAKVEAQARELSEAHAARTALVRKVDALEGRLAEVDAVRAEVVALHAALAELRREGSVTAAR